MTPDQWQHLKGCLKHVHFEYDGDPAKWRGFLLQFQLYITSQGEMTDQDKVAVMLTNLTGKALTWAMVIEEREVNQSPVLIDF